MAGTNWRSHDEFPQAFNITAPKLAFLMDKCQLRVSQQLPNRDLSPKVDFLTLPPKLGAKKRSTDGRREAQAALGAGPKKSILWLRSGF
jgi:hypothetical protein